MNTVPVWIIEALRLRASDWRERAKRDLYGFVKERCGVRANECEMLVNYIECAADLELDRMPTTEEYDAWIEGLNEEEDE